MADPLLLAKLLKYDPRNIAGVAEQALPMITGAIAEPVAGLFGAYEAARGGSAEGAGNAVREAITYQPRTQSGKTYQKSLMNGVQSIMQSAPVQTWQRGVDVAGKYSPAAGALLQSAPAAIGVMTGAKPAMQTGQSVSRVLAQAQRAAMDNAMLPRVLHPQRGAVIVDGDLKRIASFRKKDDAYQFENSEELYSAINDFVEKNSANDAFEGMILPTGHGQHNGFLMITPSAKKEGAWQVTHTDKNYMPISDEGVQTKADALESFARYSNPELWHE